MGYQGWGAHPYGGHADGCYGGDYGGYYGGHHDGCYGGGYYGYGHGHSSTFILIVVLFILLIIVGAACI
ncbi:YjcZ family sporulation protein [Lysinibacillus sp. NPDC095746]|uniref:YjcZ family sporulation protein n=1 Tax=Lysinibacillus sp. NPDC095746 TaxID=3364134 RepID=UPI0037FA7A4D